jgi:hypothetical protein
VARDGAGGPATAGSGEVIEGIEVTAGAAGGERQGQDGGAEERAGNPKTEPRTHARRLTPKARAAPLSDALQGGFRMTIKTWLAGALAATFALTLTAAAAAEERRNGDVEYRFTDDPLAAENDRAVTPQITVRKTMHKERLMRPRLQFVTEMLKSVENL